VPGQLSAQATELTVTASNSNSVGSPGRAHQSRSSTGLRVCWAAVQPAPLPHAQAGHRSPAPVANPRRLPGSAKAFSALVACSGMHQWQDDEDCTPAVVAVTWSKSSRGRWKHLARHCVGIPGGGRPTPCRCGSASCASGWLAAADGPCWQPSQQ